MDSSEAILSSISNHDSVFLYTNVQLWDVHFAETVEIAARARAQGARVNLMYCTGALSSCPANAFRSKEVCQDCNTQTLHLFKGLPKDVHLIPLQFKCSYREGNEIELEQQIKEIHNRSTLLAFVYKSVPIGRLVATQLCGDQRDYYFELDTWESVIRSRDLCRSAVSLFEQSRRRIIEQEATKVFVWNGRRPSDGPVWYAAKSLGIANFSYISGNTLGSIYCTTGSSVQSTPRHEVIQSMKHRKSVFQNNLPVETDAKLADYRSGRSTSLGYKPYRGEKTVDFESATADWRNSNLKKVLVLTSSPIEIIHRSPATSAEDNDPYGWIARLQEIAVHKRIALCVRWHPRQSGAGKYEAERIHQIISEAPESILHFAPVVDIDAYALTVYADVIVSQGSTVALSAARKNAVVVSYTAGGRFSDGSFFGEEVKKEDGLLDAILDAPRACADAATGFAFYTMTRGTAMQNVTWKRGKPRLRAQPISTLHQLRRRGKKVMKRITSRYSRSASSSIFKHYAKPH